MVTKLNMFVSIVSARNEGSSVKREKIHIMSAFYSMKPALRSVGMR